MNKIWEEVNKILSPVITFECLYVLLTKTFKQEIFFLMMYDWDIVVHGFKSTMWKAEAIRAPWVQGQFGLPSEFQTNPDYIVIPTLKQIKRYTNFINIDKFVPGNFSCPLPAKSLKVWLWSSAYVLLLCCGRTKMKARGPGSTNSIAWAMLQFKNEPFILYTVSKPCNVQKCYKTV